MAGRLLTQPGRSDGDVVAEHLALGDLAEPRGFDSLFGLEHHFTDYAMSPSPLQFLAYYAGRTRRITLGSAVIVLPWYDPIRVAEQIAVFGFGRGAARVEYEGFRIPMEEARPRFREAYEIVRRGLTQPSFEFEGEYFKIPKTSIRPAPISHPDPSSTAPFCKLLKAPDNSRRDGSVALHVLERQSVCGDRLHCWWQRHAGGTQCEAGSDPGR